MDAVQLIKNGAFDNVAENRVKYLYFLMTCIGCLTSVVRSDYNFAFGLLGYYMIKSSVD